jgi:hypothetical protein
MRRWLEIIGRDWEQAQEERKRGGVEMKEEEPPVS